MLAQGVPQALVTMSYASIAEPVAAALPSSSLADGLRTALVDGRLNLAALLVVLGWAALTSALAARFFRFDD